MFSRAKERAAASGTELSGVVTHSSGNHGQAVAWAAGRVAGVPCTVVVPEGTPEVKCRAIRGYGADLVFCAASPVARSDACARIAAETGRTVVHPYDNLDVIAGQASIAMELHEQAADLDAILVPISGGGMTSGIALATRAVRPSCKIIGVEPEGKNLSACLKAKQRLWSDPPQFLDTIAEGGELSCVGMALIVSVSQGSGRSSWAS